MGVLLNVEEHLLESYFRHTEDWRAGSRVSCVDTTSTPGYWKFSLDNTVWRTEKEDLEVKVSDLLCYLLLKIRDTEWKDI